MQRRMMVQQGEKFETKPFVTSTKIKWYSAGRERSFSMSFVMREKQ